MNDLSSAFGTVAGVLSLALFLVMVNERVTEFVLRPLVEGILKAAGKSPELASGVLPYIAALMGAAISFGFGLDLFSPLAVAVGLEPAGWVTMLLTALVVAGGSNLLHDIWPSGTAKERAAMTLQVAKLNNDTAQANVKMALLMEGIESKRDEPTGIRADRR